MGDDFTATAGNVTRRHERSKADAPATLHTGNPSPTSRDAFYATGVEVGNYRIIESDTAEGQNEIHVGLIQGSIDTVFPSTAEEAEQFVARGHQLTRDHEVWRGCDQCQHAADNRCVRHGQQKPRLL